MRSEPEYKAEVLRGQYDRAHRALIASLEAELNEWKRCSDQALLEAAGKRAYLMTSVQEKIAELHARHDAAQKKLEALKQANAAAFDHLYCGVETAIGELKTALQDARAEIAAAPAKNSKSSHCSRPLSPERASACCDSRGLR